MQRKHPRKQGPPASNTASSDEQKVMFSGFREMDSSSSGSPTSAMSPASTAGSSRSFGSGGSKARLQDKQIEKGKAIMMRDYIPTNINVMLYGESGLGKTTCIKNLIGNWEVEKMGLAFEKSGRTPAELFKENPDNLKIKLRPLRSEEANRDLLISFQDMPGWGDDINLVNSLRTVVGFLLKQRQMDFHAQDGGFPLNGAANHRGALQHAVTVCLYFVPPHRIKPVDWIMMSAISKLTAVVPVISKADTFTAKEMEDFKKEIMQVITAAAAKGEPTTGIIAPESLKPSLTAYQQKPAAMTPAAAAAAKMTAAAPAPAPATAATKAPKGAAAKAAAAAAAATPATAAAAPAGGKDAAPTAAKDTAAKTAPTPANVKTTPAAAAPVAGAPTAELTAAKPVDKATQLAALVEGEVAAAIELARDLNLETYTFSTAALEAIDADVSVLPPFAVVGSPDLLPGNAPETEGMCCPQGHTTMMPRELWPCAGEPYRRYPWGTAFPLNRSHSDLIILKQLLTGHCNTAIYDLLDDSWKRACSFAEKYRKLLLTRVNDSVRDLLTTPGLLDPLVDEVCGQGKQTPLEDRLRDEEQKKLQLELERAATRLRELEETVKTQRRALSSMQQQLSTVLQEKSQGKLKGLFTPRTKVAA